MKNGGRARYAVFDDAMSAAAVERLELVRRSSNTV